MEKERQGFGRKKVMFHNAKRMAADGSTDNKALSQTICGSLFLQGHKGYSAMQCLYACFTVEVCTPSLSYRAIGDTIVRPFGVTCTPETTTHKLAPSSMLLEPAALIPPPASSAPNLGQGTCPEICALLSLGRLTPPLLMGP
eukprot:scaffold246276_cov22-Tisochrysis_lutea.AAC.1